MLWCLCVVCAWNVCLVLRVVVWCAVSSLCGCWCWCAMRLLRLCVCVVCGAAWHAAKKKRVRPKRLRVYCQNARTCSTCGHFSGAHGDVWNVHTEGSSPLSFAISSLSHSLCLSLPFFFPSFCFSCSCSSLRVHEATTFTLLINSPPGKKKKRSGNHYLIQN